ncbi:MAG TPA: hypothetical protein VFK56_15470 [Mycobacterium sp.]|nr:hypothetical protein [Mycobacterium sp.]
MSRVLRSLGSAVLALVAAVAIGLAAPAPASATTLAAIIDVNSRPPSPLTVLVTPFAVGLHVIEAIAGGIANAVEMIATPAPITIPAPQTTA